MGAIDTLNEQVSAIGTSVNGLADGLVALSEAQTELASDIANLPQEKDVKAAAEALAPKAQAIADAASTIASAAQSIRDAIPTTATGEPTGEPVPGRRQRRRKPDIGADPGRTGSVNTLRVKGTNMRGRGFVLTPFLSGGRV